MVIQIGPVPTTDEKSHVRQNTAIQQLFSNIYDLSVSLDTLLVGRISIATGYNVQNSDKYSKLGLNGGFFTVTFLNPSNYDTIFAVTIVNEDTDKAKTIVLTNYADGTNYQFFLWPLQSYLIYSNNGRWFILGGPQRWEMPDPTIFYVDTGGSNSNDGLAVARALPDIASAWTLVQTVTSGNVLIQVTHGQTFSAIGELDGDSTGNFGRLIEIQGDTSLASPPVINIGAAQTGVKFRDGAWASMGGFRFVAGSGSVGIALEQASLVDLANNDYGSFATGVQVAVSDLSICNLTGTNKISGGADVAWSVSNLSRLFVNGSFNGASAARAFTSAFLNTLGLVLVDFSGATFVNCGSFTGQKYSLNYTSVALSGGVTLPGSIAGAADATSVYV